MNRKIVVGLLLLIVFGISFITYSTVTAEVIMYQDTDMTFNGWTIVTFTDDYKKSKEYKSHTSVECGVQDVTVYELGGIEYYFETEFFDFVDTCSSSLYQEYMVRYKLHSTQTNYSTRPIFAYIEFFMTYDERIAITYEDFNGLDFLKTRNSKYTISDYPYVIYDDSDFVVDGPSPFAHKIYQYSQAYLEENSSCLQEFSKVLFEDDEYEYIYTYTSCSEDDTQHVVRSNHWFAGYNYQDIDEYIESNRDRVWMDWETIENTKIGVKVPKDTSAVW